ncbi:hypothetical protein U1Q18_047842 [Sarracenia purpurea var. burkii]
MYSGVLIEDKGNDDSGTVEERELSVANTTAEEGRPYKAEGDIAILGFPSVPLSLKIAGEDGSHTPPIVGLRPQR